MSTTINSPVQNHQVWQKEAERSHTAKQQSKSEISRGHDSALAQETRDKERTQNVSRPSSESKQVGTEIRDVDEAQKSVEEVIRLMKSEGGESSANQVHDLNPGSIIDILV